jgi:virulence-associated protein VagC
MATARVFRHGSRQLVELPQEFQLVGDKVEIRRDGQELVLAEVAEHDPTPFGLKLLELIQSLPEDMFENIKDNRPPEEREGL